MMTEEAESEIEAFPQEKVNQIADWMYSLPGDPRLMIIIVASRADDMLKQILQTAMNHPGGSEDALFGHDRPLGTFSSRILLAYRLGVIDRDVESFLQTLRKLRNDAAHSAHEMDLATAPHIDRIITLQNLAAKSKTWGRLTERPVNAHTNPDFSLFLSVMYLIFNLSATIEQIRPIQFEHPCSFNRFYMGTIDEFRAERFRRPTAGHRPVESPSPEREPSQSRMRET